MSKVEFWKVVISAEITMVCVYGLGILGLNSVGVV